ncbi:MAG TPA: Gfo/Idh/MocA family oxidoreductase [Clostridiales bacterium]|jgi:predicted dehydrogenase|nr:Gfo/Idh/MocA family oxidoreductase [Clostridiales bacterium]
MSKVRVAIVGCGGIGGYHFSHLVNFDDVELVGFADTVKSKADSFKERAGTGESYSDFRQMINETKPEVVYICVPPYCHGEIEYYVIDKGCHFFVEKPMALDYDLAADICAQAEKKGLLTGVGFQDRYQDITDRIKDFIADRKVGLVQAAWIGGIPGVAWWRRQGTSGGQIVEQNVHLFDMARYLFGEVKTLYCAGGRGIVEPEAPEYNVPGYNVDDYSSCVLTFENGVIANIFTSCYNVGVGGIPGSGMTINCKDATVEYRLRSGVRFRTADSDEQFARQEDQGVTEDRVFIDAVKSGDGSAIRSPYSDALKTLRLCIDANESIKTGKVFNY